MRGEFKMRKSAVLAVVAFGLALPGAYAATDEWKVDLMHPAAHFSIKHMMISTVRGSFGKLSGTVDYD